jgi:DNA replication protein DnaC
MNVIDDVGSEAVPVKYYGTEINWFKDFIETIYLKQTNYSNVIITTNLGGEEIEKLYGYRVRSRLREMFNVIELTGKDLRK